MQLAILGVLVIALGGAGVFAAWLAQASAEEGARRDVARAAGLVARAGFLSSPTALEQVADFLGAEVAALDGRRRILATSLPPQRRQALAGLLEQSAGSGEAVREVSLEGKSYTLAIARADPGSAAVALLYPGRMLSERRAAALAPLLAIFSAATLLALAAGFFVARSVVRPLERLAGKAERLGRGEVDVRLELATGDEIETLSRTLAGMVESLEAARGRLEQAERLAALGRLSSALAHELRNPLASVAMILGLELERSPEGAERESLARALAEIERLDLFSGKLLTFVRGPKVNPEPTPLPPLIDDIVALLDPRLRHHGIQVERDLPAGLPDALVDAAAFRQVILNLVLNAAEACGEGGAVVVRLRHSADRLRLIVDDSGPGVPDALRERLFEPFATQKDGGTGLGLAITRAIVEAHGASIRFEDRPGGGTRFIVELAVAGEEGEQR